MDKEKGLAEQQKYEAKTKTVLDLSAMSEFLKSKVKPGKKKKKKG